MSGVELTAHTLETLSALVFLGVGVTVVAVALSIAQRLERRGLGAQVAEAGERRAHPDEFDDAGPARRNTTGPRRGLVPALFVMDDSHTASLDVEPWREATARDLAETVGHRHAAPHAWTRQESDGLVRRFRGGFRLDEVAADLDVDACAVVEELARRAFGAIEPVADPNARRFGQDWTAAELLALHSASASGLKVADIARQLGRDQLSTVFRLLESAADARNGLRDSRPGVDDVAESEPEPVLAADSVASTDARDARVREVALHG